MEYDLRNQISKLKIDIDDLSKKKKQLINEANNLKKENKKLVKLNKSLVSSRSWKLTRPLRTIKNIRK